MFAIGGTGCMGACAFSDSSTSDTGTCVGAGSTGSFDARNADSYAVSLRWITPLTAASSLIFVMGWRGGVIAVGPRGEG